MHLSSLLLLTIITAVTYVHSRYIKIKIINMIIHFFSALFLEGVVLNYYLLVRRLSMEDFSYGLCNLITGYKRIWVENVLINGIIILTILIYFNYSLYKIGQRIRKTYEHRKQKNIVGECTS